MNPDYIAGLPATQFLLLLKNDPELSNLQTNNLSEEFLQTINSTDKYLHLAKGRAIRRMNNIIAQYDHFKIGILNQKNNNPSSHKYTKLYLILKSDNAELINTIYTVFTQIFIEYVKNDHTELPNLIPAIQQQAENDCHLIYIAVRNQ